MRSSTRIRKILHIWKVGFGESSHCWKCMAYEAFLSVIPYAMARIFSEIINGIMEIRGLPVTLFCIGLYAALQFLSIKVSQFNQVAHFQLRQDYDLLARKQIENRIRTIDLTLFEDEKWKIEKLGRVNRLTHSLYDEITSQFRLFAAVLGTMLYLLYLAQLDKSLVIWGGVAFVPSIIKSVLYGKIHLKQSKRLDIHKQKYNRIYNMFFEKAFSQETRIFDSFQFIREKWTEALKNVYHQKQKAAVTQNVIDLVCAVFSIFIYTILIVKICNGSGGIGQIVATIPYSLTVAGSVNSIDMTFKSIYYSFLELEEFDLFVNSESDAGAIGTVEEEIAELNIENLSFSYPNGRDVLSDISFSIRKGEKVALVGKNGSGKSTLMKIIAGLYKPARGTVKLPGRDINNSQDVAMVFQYPVRYPFGVEENISLGESTERVCFFQDKMGICSREGVLVEGFTNSINLSGGEWQKVAISRLFANKEHAELYLFDEPTSALDPKSELEIFEYFQEMTEGKTCIYATHRLGIARQADRIIVLSNGKVAEMGTHEELIEHNGIYAKMYQMQSEWYVNGGSNACII